VIETFVPFEYVLARPLEVPQVAERLRVSGRECLVEDVRSVFARPTWSSMHIDQPRTDAWGNENQDRAPFPLFSRLTGAGAAIHRRQA
jgi:hypothetical protein